MTRKKIKIVTEFIVFFLIGSSVATILIGSLFLWLFNFEYRNKIYPGIKVSGQDLSGLTTDQAKNLIDSKFQVKTTWQFIYQDRVWKEDSHTLGVKVASERISRRAFAIGREENPYYSFLQVVSSYLGRFDLPVEIDWDPGQNNRFLATLKQEINYAPIEAQYRFSPNIGPDNRGRVVAFVQSKDGIALDEDTLQKQILSSALTSTTKQSEQFSLITLYTKSVPPDLTSDKANGLGIVEKIGHGESYFYDSIPNRIYNINLGTDKISGSLIAPNEVFSFDNAIGTVSAVFGFQKAYAIIQNKTVLDDGGGVCQVSTTLYRAVLDAGLPVVERVGHAYRVGFYEQGGFLPGLDATVYPPSPDFKFKNDTGNWLLIQANFDKINSRLTFDLYGTGDGRKTELSKPIILSSVPPPDPIYEDDPNSPVGDVKQVDTAHYGAKVYFTRKVTRNNEVLINETVTTNYMPWPARFLRGTKS